MMDIEIEWKTPIQLTKAKKIIIDGNELPDHIGDVSGVYFFSRKHGNKYIPFYIGETFSIRKRLKNHLSTKKVADVLRGIDAGDYGIKQGARWFHYGYFRRKQGQDVKRCIGIVQKYMIREALSQNVTLLNNKLTTYKSDTIKFSGDRKGRAIYEEFVSVETK